MTTKLKDKLGTGIYTLPEASLYAKVPTALLARWLFGNKKGKAVVVSQYRSHERTVGFLDLIQALAIHEIRMQKKIPIPKFRQAVKFADDSLGMQYPFAMEHTTYLLDGDIVIRRQKDGDDEYILASNKHRGQMLFRFVESYLDNLTFDENGLANRYQIFKSDRGVPITMDPRFRFGEPLLPSKLSALTIWEAVTIEGGIEQAAKAYGIPEDEVDAAYRFFVSHLGRVAA